MNIDLAEKVLNAIESLNALDDQRAREIEALRRELAEVRMAIGAITEQMVVESDLIGATQDFATRQDLADLEATVRELVATPFDQE